MSESDAEVLRLKGLRKSYNVGRPNEVEVLHGIDLILQRSDFAALIGPSGSGKSTLLNLIGLLDQPSAGELYLLGRGTSSMEEAERTRLRGREIGFVFQFHHLTEAFSAIENVLMPLMLSSGKPDARALKRARSLLQDVGVADQADKPPSQLSGGEQQRVAIARALITEPSLLLADEPTGNLDTETAASVLALLRRFNRELGCAVLLVTHDLQLARSCDRIVELVDGEIINDSRIDF